MLALKRQPVEAEGLSPLIAKLLANRQITTPEAAHLFFNGERRISLPPFCWNGRSGCAFGGEACAGKRDPGLWGL